MRRLSRSNDGRERPAETQDGVRTSFSGLRYSVFDESRISGASRGTGPVKGTGFYEGSLSVEGTSGRHEPSSFTRRWSRRPLRLPHAGDGRGSTLQKREQPRSMALRRQRPRHPAEAGRGDRGVRGTIVSSAPWDQQAHARSPSCGIRHMDAVENGALWRCVAHVGPPKRSRVS